MKAKDIMTRGVQTVTRDHSVRDAAEKMKTLHVGSLPAYEGDKLYGMITDRDITTRAVAPERDIRTTKVRDVMSGDPVFCCEDEDVRLVEKKMEEKQIRRLPVLDRSDLLVGIIALADVARKVGHEESDEHEV